MSIKSTTLLTSLKWTTSSQEDEIIIKSIKWTSLINVYKVDDFAKSTKWTSLLLKSIKRTSS